MPASGAGRIQLAMSLDSTNVIYASIASNSTYGVLGLYASRDGGNTWTLKNSSTNYLGSQGWYDNAITVKPGNTNFVVVGGLDVYTSTNSGTTLTQKSIWYASNSSNFAHADIHFLKYNGSVLYCASDGGVYKSTDDGNTWTDLNYTISTLQYQSADYDVSNLQRLYGGSQDNDKETTTDGGTDWIQRTTGDGGYTIVDPVNSNYIYSQYVNGSLERSSNYGVSFTEISPSGSSGGLFYNPYEMAPGDHNTIVFGRADVWKTTSVQTATSASGWTQIASTSTIGGSVSAIGISSTNINVIYIGTSNGKILVTTNNGSTWIVTTALPYVSDFAVDNINDNVAYAVFGGTSGTHVYKTTSYGLNWSNISGSIPNIAANSTILKTSSPRMLFVGTDLGVFQTTDEGLTWISFNSGLPSVAIYDMKYKESAGYLLAATHGRGVWTFNLLGSLPVLLEFFNGVISDRNIMLQWRTCEEINNKGFSIERNVIDPLHQGSNWKEIGFVNGHGTVNSQQTYSWIDKELQIGTYEYRLKQIDYSGNYEYFNLTNPATVEIQKPENFNIFQNFPNPFNPKTKITYEVPYDSKVNIKIYDVTGKEVLVLVDQKQVAGYYSVIFDGTNLTSGIYFYRIEADNFVEVKKMVLIK